MNSIRKLFIGRKRWLFGLLAATAYFTVTAIALDVENPIGRYLVGNLNMDAGVPDLEMGYSTKRLANIFKAYGRSGIMDYQRNLFLLDVGMPFLWTLASLFFLGWVAHALQKDRLNWLLWVPITAFGLDLFENILLYVAAGAYPTLPDGLVAAASTATVLKWCVLYVNTGVLTGGLLWVGMSRLTTKRSTEVQQ